jgi:hypothetical protein
MRASVSQIWKIGGRRKRSKCVSAHTVINVGTTATECARSPFCNDRYRCRGCPMPNAHAMRIHNRTRWISTTHLIIAVDLCAYPFEKGLNLCDDTHPAITEMRNFIDRPNVLVLFLRRDLSGIYDICPVNP